MKPKRKTDRISVVAIRFEAMGMTFTVECELEEDGRWLAEVIDLRGLDADRAPQLQAVVMLHSR